MVEKHVIISEHDYMVNWCTYLDFGQFSQWKKNINICYTTHIHSPIYACCHIPQIDDK